MLNCDALLKSVQVYVVFCEFEGSLADVAGYHFFDAADFSCEADASNSRAG